MNNFNFNLPTSVRYGWGRVNEIGKIASSIGKNCLLVTVKSFPAMETLFEKVKMLCKEAGIEVIHFDGVIPNPTIDSINQASEIAIKNKINVILGVGGGSSIDTAKGIAVAANQEGDIWDYRFGKKRIQGNKVLPIIAVPTTAGTGAEVTSVAVIKNVNTKEKNAIADWSLAPKVAIIDPELTLTVPATVTATTGFDTFCHLFESYINKYGSYLTNLITLDSLKLVIKYLPKAIEDPSNKEARDALSLASTMGGICINNIGTTLPHSIDMSIGGHHPKISHSEALAIVYPEINRWTWKSAISKYATIGKLFNSELNNQPDEVAAERACDEIDGFMKKIGLWISFEDKGISESDLKAIVDDSMNIPNYKFHPKVADLKDIDEIVKKSYKK
ncbi:MAG: iron-containing alcohol dehydrogenase [Promethearchaeota archaeon]